MDIIGHVFTRKAFPCKSKHCEEACIHKHVSFTLHVNRGERAMTLRLILA